jgi:GGDEF domain-containing protein
VIIIKKNLIFLNFLLSTSAQFLLFYLFLKIIPIGLKPLYFAYFFILILLTYFYDNLKSFTFLVAVMLSIAFYYVAMAWISPNEKYSQFNMIAQQLIVITLSVFLWVQSIYVKNIVNKNENLERRVKELEKINPETGIMNFREFLDRAETIYTAIKRRKENGQLIIIKLADISTGGNLKTSKTLMKLLGEAIIKSIRKNYDIVGIYDSNTFMALLQNTNQFGSEIVINRIKDNISKVSSLNSDELLPDLKFIVKDVDNEFVSFDEIIKSFLNAGE